MDNAAKHSRLGHLTNLTPLFPEVEHSLQYKRQCRSGRSYSQSEDASLDVFSASVFYLMSET